MKAPQTYINGTAALKEDYDTVKEIVLMETAQKPAYRHSFAYLFMKRAFDICASLFGLILLSPLFLGVAVAIRAESRGRVIYKHERLGKHGKIFKMYKFRSMVHNSDEIFKSFTPEQKADYEINFKMLNDPRITKVGRFIRNTSLDELPQLMNILLGHLSVVGPRPIVKKEALKYGANIDKFLSVKPGLTGYWQVNGRSCLNYDDRMDMELYYADNCSFGLDMSIFIKTFAVILGRKGAY